MRVQRIIRPHEIPEVEYAPGGAKRPATDDDLLQMGYLVHARLPAGTVVPLPDGTSVTAEEGTLLVDDAEFDETKHAGRHGTPITKPRLQRARYHELPAGPIKQRAHRAIVYRAVDPTVNLRTFCNAATTKSLAARVPASTRGRSATPADPAGAALVLEEARKLAQPVIGGAPPAARRLVVSMTDVQDGDVVEEDGIRGGGFLGEPIE